MFCKQPNTMAFNNILVSSRKGRKKWMKTHFYHQPNERKPKMYRNETHSWVAVDFEIARSCGLNECKQHHTTTDRKCTCFSCLGNGGFALLRRDCTFFPQLAYNQTRNALVERRNLATAARISHKERKLEAFDGINFIFMVVILQCSFFRWLMHYFRTAKKNGSRWGKRRSSCL